MARCAGPPRAGHHLDRLAACREHRDGLLGPLALQEGRSAVLDQHQNRAAGHRCHPERPGVTSGRLARRDRFAEPLDDRQVQAGDLAPASHPAGLERRPVHRARH